MNWIQIFVRRPVMTLMIVMVFVVLGAFSYTRMKVDRFPEIDVPMVQVVCVYPGAGPDEVESQMIKKIEDEISNISDIKQIQSRVFENFGFIMVRFNLGADIDIKALEMKDKVEAIKQDLPDNAEAPIISKFNPLIMAVAKIALTSRTKSGRDLYEYADQNLKDYFGQVTGVAKVELLGGARRQINVWLAPEKLAQYYLTPLDVISALGQQDLDVPAGNIKTKNRELGVRFRGEARTVEEIGNLTLSNPAGAVIKLQDLARIEDGEEERNSLVRYKGEEAVVLEIYKRSDGNAIEVADGIYKRLASARAMVPADVKISLADDESGFIRAAVADTKSSIFLGVLFCALVLYVFLRDLRLTIVASLVIPTSIVSAFLLMDAFGFTLNILSLAALGISIGSLVANAIVVLENIMTHVERGETPAEASVTGTKEIAVAVLASAGTNIVVFTPIAFMGGIVGRFFYQFGMTVVFASIFSLFASFSLTPMLASLILKRRQGGVVQQPKFLITRIVHYPLELVNRLVQRVQDGYASSLGPVFVHPALTLGACLILTICLLLTARWVGFEFLPVSDEGKLNLEVWLPPGSNYQGADRVLSDIEKIVKDIPELKDYISKSGGENAGFDQSKIEIRMVDRAERRRSIFDIMYALNPKLARVPGAEIFFSPQAHGGGESDLDINVIGQNYPEMIERSTKMRDLALGIGDLATVFNTYRPPKDEIHFYPDNYRRANYGIPNAALGLNLRYAIEGEDAAVMRVGGEEYEVNVRLQASGRDSPLDLPAYRAMTRQGAVTLSQLGTFKNQKATPSLRRLNKQRIILLRSFIAQGALSAVQQKLVEKFKTAGWELGRDYEFTGSSEELAETSRNILVAMILAIILTYMLLAAILDSLIHPLTILVTVPLGIAGVIVALFFSGTSLNVMSMMAVVMLVGIVVNNAILIIDWALQLAKAGDSSPAEYMRQACMDKFRAILMTNAAIVAGILPQVLGGSGTEFLTPLAVATMGGVLVSTLFTFFAVPALFLLVEKWAAIVRGKMSREWKRTTRIENGS